MNGKSMESDPIDSTIDSRDPIDSRMVNQWSLTPLIYDPIDLH